MNTEAVLIHGHMSPFWRSFSASWVAARVIRSGKEGYRACRGTCNRSSISQMAACCLQPNGLLAEIPAWLRQTLPIVMPLLLTLASCLQWLQGACPARGQRRCDRFTTWRTAAPEGMRVQEAAPNHQSIAGSPDCVYPARWNEQGTASSHTHTHTGLCLGYKGLAGLHAPQISAQHCY